MKTDNLAFSVIIPVYREGAILEDTCGKISDYFESRKSEYEIIIVNDGGPRDTIKVAEKIASKNPRARLLVNGRNMGKGYSIKKGMLSAKGKYVLFSDADLSTPITELEKLERFLDGGFDVVIGSRVIAGADVRVRQPWHRAIAGKIFNLMVRAALFLNISDTQCGFKCFGGEAAKEIFGRQTIERFSFDVEDLFIARKLGYRIKEVPIVWIASGSSTVSFIKDSVRMFTDLLRIRLNDMRGKYS